MAKAVPIIGIVGAVLAALTATILVDVAPAIVGILTLGMGIFLAISKDWRRRAPGIGAGIFAILGILGVIGSVGGEDGEVTFPISAAIGTAFIIASGLELAGASALMVLDREPKWMAYTWIGAAALGFILAIVFSGQLSDQTQPGGFIVAVLALVSMGGAIQLLRSGQ